MFPVVYYVNKVFICKKIFQLVLYSKTLITECISHKYVNRILKCDGLSDQLHDGGVWFWGH